MARKSGTRREKGIAAGFYEGPRLRAVRKAARLRYLLHECPLPRTTYGATARPLHRDQVADPGLRAAASPRRGGAVTHADPGRASSRAESPAGRATPAARGRLAALCGRPAGRAGPRARRPSPPRRPGLRRGRGVGDRQGRRPRGRDAGQQRAAARLHDRGHAAARVDRLRRARRADLRVPDPARGRAGGAGRRRARDRARAPRRRGAAARRRPRVEAHAAVRRRRAQRCSAAPCANPSRR